MLRTGLILFSYILGSVPFGLIIGLLWKGIDIRKVGSGNIGTTNTFRVLGTGPGIAVFILDVSKGLVPVLLAHKVIPGVPWVTVVCALIVILGHTFSVFLNFRGGKGVATSLGAILGLSPIVGVIAFVLWVTLVAITRYVSIASLAAAVSIPTMMFIRHEDWTHLAFAILAATFVIIKHRSNMDRLMHGKEPRWGDRVSAENVEGKNGRRIAQ